MKAKKRLCRLGDVLGRDRVRYLADELSPRTLRALVDEHELAALRGERRRRKAAEAEEAERAARGVLTR